MYSQIINESQINYILHSAINAPAEEIKFVIEKARKAQGLTPEEAAILLQNKNPDVTQLLFAAAREVKDLIYGKRVVMFAPLYISNRCVNNCVYCSYRTANKTIRRKVLTTEEIKAQVRILESYGHKRILVECGEDPTEVSIDRVVEIVKTIYRAGDIRRVNVNISATGEEEYRKLLAGGIGTSQLFQETYHRETYAQMHPTGPKANYDYHLDAHERAYAAGIDNLGLGILFGLYDYRFDVIALLKHAEYLEQTLGVGPHTISVPRWRPSPGIDPSLIPYLVDDDDFKRVVAILRLAVPYTGIILSIHEKADIRDQLIALGVSQMSAGANTEMAEMAGFGPVDYDLDRCFQFKSPDIRTPEEVVRRICELGYLPSFCTACYRKDRTGQRFMALAKTGEIHDLCQPNSLLTFQEYLEDYASWTTKSIGEQIIEDQLDKIPNAELREWTSQSLKRIRQGARDLHI